MDNIQKHRNKCHEQIQTFLESWFESEAGTQGVYLILRALGVNVLMFSLIDATEQLADTPGIYWFS